MTTKTTTTRLASKASERPPTAMFYQLQGVGSPAPGPQTPTTPNPGTGTVAG
jgi:hypothetical protein